MGSFTRNSGLNSRQVVDFIAGINIAKALMPRAQLGQGGGSPWGCLHSPTSSAEIFTAVHTRKVDGCDFFESTLPRSTDQQLGADFQLFAQPCQHHGADTATRREFAKLL